MKFGLSYAVVVPPGDTGAEGFIMACTPQHGAPVLDSFREVGVDRLIIHT